MVARGWRGWGNDVWSFFLGSSNVLKLDHGDGCAILYMPKTTVKKPSNLEKAKFRGM